MRGVSYPTFRYLRVLSERRRLAIKRIFWITSAIWFYLIYQNWTPPLDCEVASLTWWIIYTFVGAAIILTLTVWKWEIKFAAKAWYEGRDDYHEQLRLTTLGPINTAQLNAKKPSINLASMDVKAQQASIRRYCDHHPLGNYIEAVWNLMVELQSKHASP